MAGLGDKIAGKAKEVEGKVTGDETREAQGKAQGLRGDAKEKMAGMKDQAEGALREAGGKLSGDESEELRGRAEREAGDART